MKHKLLKKVRKRYSITRIDKLASNAGNVYTYCADTLGLPFYVLEDAVDWTGIHTKFYETFDDAREHLCRWIVADYGEKFRHKPGKQVKVWWEK